MQRSTAHQLFTMHQSYFVPSLLPVGSTSGRLLTSDLRDRINGSWIMMYQSHFIPSLQPVASGSSLIPVAYVQNAKGLGATPSIACLIPVTLS